MAIPDMAGKIILRDHFAHIAKDFLGGRDGRTTPRFEAIAEGMEITIRTNAGIFMRPPCAPEGLLGFQHHKTLIWALCCQMIGRADA